MASVGRSAQTRRRLTYHHLPSESTTNPSPVPGERTVSVALAASILGVHSNTVRTWTEQGRLPVLRINARGDRRYRVADLEAFLEAARQVPRPLGGRRQRWLAEPSGGHAAPRGPADRRTRELRVLGDIAQLTAHVTDLDTTLHRICQLLREGFDYRLVGVAQLRDGAILARVAHGVPVDRLPAMPIGSGIVGSAIAERRTILVPEVRLDPRYVEIVPEVETEIVVPIEGADRDVGLHPRRRHAPRRPDSRRRRPPRSCRPSDRGSHRDRRPDAAPRTPAGTRRGPPTGECGHQLEARPAGHPGRDRRPGDDALRRRPSRHLPPASRRRLRGARCPRALGTLSATCRRPTHAVAAPPGRGDRRGVLRDRLRAGPTRKWRARGRHRGGLRHHRRGAARRRWSIAAACSSSITTVAGPGRTRSSRPSRRSQRRPASPSRTPAPMHRWRPGRPSSSRSSSSAPASTGCAA